MIDRRHRWRHRSSSQPVFPPRVRLRVASLLSPALSLFKKEGGDPFRRGRGAVIDSRVPPPAGTSGWNGVRRSIDRVHGFIFLSGLSFFYHSLFSFLWFLQFLRHFCFLRFHCRALRFSLLANLRFYISFRPNNDFRFIFSCDAI